LGDSNRNEWPATITQQLYEIITFDAANEINHIRYKLEVNFQGKGQIVSRRFFVNDGGIELPPKSSYQANLLAKFNPVFLLAALRNASQEFGQRGHFWN
jgi:putative ATP-dependent endonuclease of OLD family